MKCLRDHNHSTREGAVACDSRLGDPFPNCRGMCYETNCVTPIFCSHVSQTPNADYVLEHQQLRATLKNRIVKSITSVSASGRTVEDPAQAAEYAVNALMEWQPGWDLLRAIVNHLDSAHFDRKEGDGT